MAQLHSICIFKNPGMELKSSTEFYFYGKEYPDFMLTEDVSR